MKRSVPVQVVFTLAVLLLMTDVALAGQEVFPVNREFYPYYPSLIKWERSGAGFTAPEDCAGCHPQQYEEWTGSTHAQAFHDPLYQGELNLAVKAVGHDISRQCEGCHSPAGMVTGEIKGPGLKGLGPVARAGVSCDICHSISGVTHCQTPSRDPENGSLVLAPGRDAADGPKLVKRGPYPPSAACGMAFHECMESPLHKSADLCASCHQIYHFEKHFPIESTYDEWKGSTYAQRGISCQDCHMVEFDAYLRSADLFHKPDRKEYQHYFSGANYLLASLGQTAAKKAGDNALAANLGRKYEMAVKRLQSAAGVEIHPQYRNRRLAEIKVRVKNVRAGHNLPTSLTNVREMWLEITARDSAGKVLLASGGLDKNGRLLPETRTFTSDGMADNFHFAVEPWMVTGFSRNDTIPPKGFRDVYYAIDPGKSPGDITVEARLRYRQADQKLAEKLLASLPADMNLEAIYGITKVPELPVVDMAKKKARVEVRR